MARILVVDDDEALLSILEQFLVAAGHAVVTAADGLKAAKLFHDGSFDLIITDLVMPNREGLENIIALHREFPEVGIIAMSGGKKMSTSCLRMAAHLGAHRTLAKPFTGDTLLETVEQVLHSKFAKN